MRESLDGRKDRRRRNWIIALSLPCYLAMVMFGLMASLQTIVSTASDAWMLPGMFIGLVGVASWAFGPILWLIALVVFAIDLWRHRRSRLERLFLTFFLVGSPVAWFVSNLINDAYHLLR
jgi:hypothetical protein